MHMHRRFTRAALRATVGIMLAAVALFVGASISAAHDLFLRAANYFVAPNSNVLLRVLNGTFSKSENAVTADRLHDLSLVSPAGTVRLDTANWAANGDTARLTVRVSGEGTYVVGASLEPRELTLSAKEFNAYLASDGVADVLAARRRAGELNRPARERYSKHVKALLQVGDAQSDNFATSLGYPAELVPIDNPYAIKVGGVLRVRALVDDEPVVGQLVLAGGRNPSGGRLAERSARTDSAGVARIRIASRGVWYLKFIHMVRATNDTSIDYE